MIIEDLLQRLEGVRDRKNGQWLACCPAHDDSSPSLSIKETADGTILIHCFGSCGVADVVAALNLELSDLFPEETKPRSRVKPRWNPKDLLLAIKHEALVVACEAGRMAEGEPVDTERVNKAAHRIIDALEVGNVR